MPFKLHWTIAIIFLLLGAYARAGVQAQPPAVNVCSSVPVQAPMSGALASDGSRIFVGTAAGYLIAIDGKSSEILWRSELGGVIISDIAVLPGGLAVVTNLRSDALKNASSRLHFLNADSGLPVWNVPVTYSERYYLGKTDNSIIAVGQAGFVSVIDPAGGNVLRQIQTEGQVSARPAFSDAGVVLALAGKRTAIVSSAGELSSKNGLDFQPTAAFQLNDGRLAVGDERGNLALFGPDNTRSVWKFKSGAAVSSIVETEEGLLVTSLDNFVYLVSDYNGDVIWKRRLSGRVSDGGLLAGSSYLIIVPGENQLYVLDRLKGKITDVVNFDTKELVSRVPVRINAGTFALTAANSVEILAFSACSENKRGGQSGRP